MSESGEPYIPADQEPAELTPRVFVIGIVLGTLMTAANAYLGLKVGMTVSASIPAAVMSMLILRGLKFKDVSILENNSVQTMASAGESLAAGVIFTVPALLVMNIWSEIQLLETFIIATLGGVLGTMFTIALRRVFIVEEALPYPEGVACREVLVAGEKGGSGLVAIIYALIIGALYGWFVKGFHITKELVQGAWSFFGTRVYAGSELSLALLSVGYIVGLRIASFIFLGGVLGFLVLVPMYGMMFGWPAGDMTAKSMAAGFMTIWGEQIRFIGVGAMVVGGIYTLWSMRKTIVSGFSKALNFDDEDSADLLRTEQDIDMRKVLAVCAGITLLTFLFYWWVTGEILLAFVGAAFLAVAAFFFSAVAGYIAGVVGSSNSPVSGMTIATLMFTAGLVWVVGDLVLGMTTESLMTATLIIAAVVAVNAAIAGDVMQDLKTGHMVGATPWRQQVAEIVGVMVGAIAIGPVLMLLHNAFRISKTACIRDPPLLDGKIPVTAEEISEACETALLAPQAELIGAIISGIFGGDFNLPMVLIGVAIACIIIWKKMPVMSVAIGIYLPLYLSVPIILGGLIHFFVSRITHYRIDGTLEGEASERAEETAKKVTDKGVLIGAGFIAGESLMGVLIAFFIVVWKHPNKWFGWTDEADKFHPAIEALPQSLSILFYGCFVAIFAFLATRAVPRVEGHTFLTDCFSVITDAGRRFIESVRPR